MMTDQNATIPAEWDAQTYHRVSNPHVVWGRPVLDRLPLAGNETVVDAGCGTGRLTARILDRVPNGHVIAVDRSANMLAEARRHLLPTYGDRVSFIQSDLYNLATAAPRPVDRIFSTATFHWIHDHQRLFQALHDALAPGGWVVAQCGGGPNIARIQDHAAKVMAESRFAAAFAGWPGPWNFADAEETAERLAEVGFTEVETEVIAAPVTRPDAEAFAEYGRSVVFGEHLARIPPETHADFIAAITERAAEDTPPFTYDYWRLNLKGRRTA